MLHNNSRKYITISFLLMLFVLQGCRKQISLKDAEATSSSIRYLNAPGEILHPNASKTSDGGFIYFGDVNGNAFLMKADAKGNKEWYKTYGSNFWTFFHSVFQASDGGYYAFGHDIPKDTMASNPQSLDGGYIVRTNSNGDTLWTRRVYFYTPQRIQLYTRIMGGVETPDHKIVFTGYYWNGQMFPFTEKYDETGNYITHRTYAPGTGWYDFGTSVTMTKDGKVLLAGEMSQSNSTIVPGGLSNKVTFLAKVNATTLLSEYFRKYSAMENNYVYPYYFNNGLRDNRLAPKKVIEVSDGYLIGTFIATSITVFQMELIKTDFSGNIVWEKKYPGLGSSLLWDLQTCDDGNFLLVGATTKEPFSYAKTEGYSPLKLALVKVDPNGILINSIYSGGEQNVTIANTVQQMPDGSYTIAGFTYLDNARTTKMFWLQLDKNGKMMNTF
jgi:hypothetical protein